MAATDVVSDGDAKTPAPNRGAQHQRRPVTARPSMGLDYLSPVRRQILMELKTSGYATAEDLGRAAFLSAGATRQHLVALEAEGLVKYDVERRGPGRPSHLYALTPRGHQLFGNGYLSLSDTLLRAALDGSPEWREEALIALENCYLPASVSYEGEAALDNVIADLNVRGFLATAQCNDDGTYLTLRHCPLLQLATAFPELCQAGCSSLRRSLGTDTIELVEHRLRGDMVCTFRAGPSRGSSSTSTTEGGQNGG